MGTAGPLALARDILYNDSNTPFFVLNRWGPAGWLVSLAGWAPSWAPARAPAAPPPPLPHTTSHRNTPPPTHTSLRSDVVCEYPMKELLEQHLRTGAEGTILVTKVCVCWGCVLGGGGRAGRAPAALPGGPRCAGRPGLTGRGGCLYVPPCLGAMLPSSVAPCRAWLVRLPTAAQACAVTPRWGHRMPGGRSTHLARHASHTLLLLLLHCAACRCRTPPSTAWW